MRKFEKISFEQFKKDVSNNLELYKAIELPKRSTMKSAGYDIKSIEAGIIKPGCAKSFKTGLKVTMNDDEVLYIYSRSSQGYKYNVCLANSVGVIDSDFYNNPSNEGHFQVRLINLGESDYEVKDIAKLEENLTSEQIELARWMAKRYFCNVSDCIKLMLTPGTRGKEKKVQDKKINVVYLKKNIEEIDLEIEIGKIKSEKHKRIINFVKQNEGVAIPEIEMYADCSRSIVNTLVKKGYLEIVEKKIERDPLEGKNIEKTNKLELTDEQQIAFEKVKMQMGKEEYKSFLLYGVTGSRKN